VHGQAEEIVGPVGIAEDVSLRGVLALASVRLADAEAEDIVVGVVIGIVESDGSDLDVHFFHESGSFRLGNALISRTGSCS
jgi:hypothetical protein